MSPGGTIIINSVSTLSGELRIETGNSELEVAYYKRLKVPSRSEAIEFANAISVEIEPGPDGITINMKAPSPAPWSSTDNSGKLYLEITLPRDCIVEINSAYFDINAKGPFAAFRVTESLSQVFVDGVRGDTKIKVSNRPLEVKNLSGPFSLTNKYNKININSMSF